MATTDNGRENLKSLFGDGARPNGSDFALLIDSFVNRYDGIFSDEIGEMITESGDDLKTRLANLLVRLDEDSEGLTLQPLTETGDRNLILMPRNDGKIGIGQSSPQNFLEISSKNASLKLDSRAGEEYGTQATLKLIGARGGDDNEFADLRFYNFDANGQNSDLNSAGIKGVRSGADGSKLTLYTANGGTTYDRLTLDNGGNIGIGTKSPEEKLELNGQNCCFLVNGKADETSEASGQIKIRGAQSDDDGIIGLLSFENYDDAQEDPAIFESGSILLLREDVQGSQLQFKTADEGSQVTRLTLTKSGRLGIGTTNPSSLLELAQDNATLNINGRNGNTENGYQGVLNLRGKQTSNGGVFGSINFYNHDEYSNKTKEFKAASIKASKDSNGSGQLDFSTTYLFEESTKLTITDEGKVGIGTTGPVQKLDIMNGFMNLHTDDDSLECGALFQNSSGLYEWKVYRAATDEGSSDLRFAGGSTYDYGGSTSSYNGMEDLFTFTQGGEFKVKGSKPIEVRRYSGLGDDISYDTGYSVDDFSAAISGFAATSVNINEDIDGGTFMKIRMIIGSNNTWVIQADLSSESDHENWYVDVLFISTALSFATNF